MALKKHSEPAATNTTVRVDPKMRREAEEQRKRARTLARQQQAAERIATACAQLATGINEAATTPFPYL